METMKGGKTPGQTCDLKQEERRDYKIKLDKNQKNQTEQQSELNMTNET